MIRLYTIREHKFGRLVRSSVNEVIFFRYKDEAKKIRDSLNLPHAVVSFGPDHKKGNSPDLSEFKVVA